MIVKMARLLIEPIVYYHNTYVVQSVYHEKLLVGGIILSFIGMFFVIKKFILKIR
jgi:hypothetical protein